MSAPNANITCTQNKNNSYDLISNRFKLKHNICSFIKSLSSLELFELRTAGRSTSLTSQFQVSFWKITYLAHQIKLLLIERVLSGEMSKVVY